MTLPNEAPQRSTNNAASSEPTHPKFRVGQVVIMASLKKELPFRIVSAYWEEGWFYGYNSKNCVSEDMIRTLKSEEI